MRIRFWDVIPGGYERLKRGACHELLPKSTKGPREGCQGKGRHSSRFRQSTNLPQALAARPKRLVLPNSAWSGVPSDAVPAAFGCRCNASLGWQCCPAHERNELLQYFHSSIAHGLQFPRQPLARRINLWSRTRRITQAALKSWSEFRTFEIGRTG